MKHDENFGPFGGLLEDTIYNKLLMELMAGSPGCYNLMDVMALCQFDRCDEETVRSSLEYLIKIGILGLCEACGKLKINMDSKRMAALTMLAFASSDDYDKDDNTGLFEKSMVQYYNGKRSMFMPFGRKNRSVFAFKHKVSKNTTERREI